MWCSRPWFLAIGLWALSVPTADACTCGEKGRRIYLPLADSVIPPNSHVWAALDFQRGGIRSDDISVRVDGQPWDGEIVRHDFWRFSLVEWIPLEPFPSGSHVKVNVSSEEVSVTVGDLEDLSGPEWDGEFTITSNTIGDDTFSCGWSGFHLFEFPTAFDDTTPSDALLWELVPVGRGREVIGFGHGYVSWNDVCGGNDDTLEGGFHRAYDATPIDMSGRRGDTLRIRTSSGCCSGPAPESEGEERPLTPGNGAAMLLPLLVAWRRRCATSR